MRNTGILTAISRSVQYVTLRRYEYPVTMEKKFNVRNLSKNILQRIIQQYSCR